MKLINRFAYNLRKFPKIKFYLKEIYQLFGNIISDKKNFPSEIEQLSNGNYDSMFGYYDKCPWNKDEDKIIYMNVSDANKFVSSTKPAQIIIKNVNDGKEKILGTTTSWNVQQGCMLQWLGPDFNSKILYNDFINNELKCVIIDVNTNKKRIIDSPVYDVAKSGEFALSLDFYRLHRLRPGYGYSNKEDLTKSNFDYNDYCIWYVDLKKGKRKGIITYEQLIKIDTKNTMMGAEHKVNHIMINPSGNRFMFLHRWIKDGVKYTRLLTSDINGKNIYNLLDNDMVSHCIWKDDNTILSWAKIDNSGVNYYLLSDESHKFKKIAENDLRVDGHPSYNADKTFFVTDTYPDFKRKQHIYLYNTKTKKTIEIASVYSNIKYRNDCRCDLHPRWNYSGDKICFDGAQKNKRQVYVIDIKKYINEEEI